jgi:hypothetical protein
MESSPLESKQTIKHSNKHTKQSNKQKNKQKKPTNKPTRHKNTQTIKQIDKQTNNNNNNKHRRKATKLIRLGKWGVGFFGVPFCRKIQSPFALCSSSHQLPFLPQNNSNNKL